jgi:periplasmic protein TonB
MRCRLVVVAPVALFLLAQALLAGSPPKAVAIYAPAPEYPALANGKRPEGSGIFVLHINAKTGVVKSVSVTKTTGSPILDKAAIDAVRRWKFRPGSPLVRIPMTLTAHGATY